MRKLKTILQYNKLYLIILIFTITFALLITLIPNYKSKYNKNTTKFSCTIDTYKTDGNKLELKLKCKEKLIGNYYFKTKEEKRNFTKNIKVGDKIKIKGTLKKPKNNTVPFLFNYKKYLYNQKIYYILNIEEIKKKKGKPTLLYKIKKLAYQKADKITKNEYIYAYLLGKTDKINEEVINSYRINGISHLFALSGLHVNVFSVILLKLLSKFKIKEIKKYIIIFILLMIFAFITGLSPSILRATLLFLLAGINKTLKLNIKNINILYLTFSIFLLINPFLIYNLSFILSYSATFFIIISAPYISDKNYTKGLLKISLLTFISNIGLSIYYFNYINPVGILINLIFVPLVTFIIFPLTILVYFIPAINIILNHLTNIMESISLILSKYAFKIYFPHINITNLIAYYTILILMIKTKKIKYIIPIILLIISWKIKPYLNPNTIIYFIDVGQGDSCLIITPYNKTSILIDTGGNLNYKVEKWALRSKKYNITKDTLIPFMRNIGVEKIDYTFITHGDQDHGGEILNLTDSNKTKKIYINNGKENNLEQKIKNKTKINFKKLEIDNIKLSSLNNKIYNNENDNSIVLLLEINQIKILLMGDASEKIEKEITKKYNLSNIDVLKVGHHGSKTSSSKEFINIVKPKYSIISVGENNRFKHPHEETLKNLSNSIIYRTDKNGSITIKIKKNKLKIIQTSP